MQLARSDSLIATQEAEEEDSTLERATAVALIIDVVKKELLLIRRADDPRDPWSGHMALPGGRRDPLDVNLMVTACRESLEEVGVQLSPEDCFGALPRLKTYAAKPSMNLSVRPFIFHLEEKKKVIINHEVSEYYWVPLEHFAPERIETFTKEIGSSLLTFPSWVYQERRIWGLTQRIIQDYMQRCGGQPRS
ncbi:MAG: CoA pyrophosphatase [Polyangiaceae bacterium]|nr:CoA pyrophosphatase [Polyangiaceae bacterium]